MHSVRPLFLSTYPPEKCGLATFTKDSADAVDLAAGTPVCSIAAIQKTGTFLYDNLRVTHVIKNNQPAAYRRAAEFVNDGPYDVVSVQHEFGLYPGEWGNEILEFARSCRRPIVVTLHTLLTRPPAIARHIVRQLAERSSGVVVMTDIAATLLRQVYGVDNRDIHVIPHGVPAVPLECANAIHKIRLRLAGHRIICTFGLINRGKGLEYMIEALPRIIAEYPDAVYLIIGATHPQVKLAEGETYRESLMSLARSRGVEAHVLFVNKYLSLSELMEHLQACDVYVTPYPGADQIASGTLAYAMAAGRAVVSTPYLYAAEVLAGGRGQLAPFCESAPLADAVLRLLSDTAFRVEMQGKAYRYAEQMFWPRVGRQYWELFEEVAAVVVPAADTSDSTGLVPVE